MKYNFEPDVNLISGDMPNIQMPTMGGKVFWDTQKTEKGYKLQINIFTGHGRILNANDERIAWGDEKTMTDKFERITADEPLKAGDIIGVRRYGGIYEHYAVYVGNDEIIHYAAEEGDFDGTVRVHKSTMKKFLDGSKEFFVLAFPEEHSNPVKIGLSAAASEVSVGFFVNAPDMPGKDDEAEKYRLYSPEETVKRAESRLGETSYNLVTNNCEHFAIWCKTGISESHQVRGILDALRSAQLMATVE